MRATGLTPKKSNPLHGMQRSVSSVEGLSWRRWARRVAILASLLIVALIVTLQSGVLSRGWREGFTVRTPSPMLNVPARVPKNGIGIAPPVPKGNDSSLSPVPLPLFLVSVKTGKSIREGSARIGVVRESPQTYQAGALLENGARLTEIHAGYVVLEKSSHTARLYLADSEPSAPNEAAMVSVGGNTRAEPAAITSREPLTDYIRPSPVFEGESVIGLRIYAGSKSGLFFQMGLHQGDVITAIDGAPVADLTSSWERLRALADGAVLAAAVKRNGEILQVTLDGGLVASAEAAGTEAPAQAMLGPPIR
jgi:hypothetical protein